MLKSWLTTLLESARDSPGVAIKSNPASAAKAIISTLKGALISARTFGDPERYRAATQWIIDSIDHDSGS